MAISKDSLQELIDWQRQKRDIKRNGFVPYCKAFDFIPAPHHLVLTRELERIVPGESYNVMFFLPPGHAKSTYGSILFPSYYLGRYPDKSIIAGSHTADFAQDIGRACRRLVVDDKYQYLMDTCLTTDSKSASRFDLVNGSKYYGVGVEGSVTGRRGDVGLIDDPIKGIKDADSEVKRKDVWNWFKYDFSTRLKPGASKIVIQTRWHEDDLAGRILNSPEGKRWTVICLPALAEENDPMGRIKGEALWPDYINLQMLNDIRDGLDREDIRMWNSLYQQKPTQEEGYYYKKEWIQRINKVPSGLNYYGASDYAITEGRGDYTVHIVIGHDPKKDDIYIVDVWRKRTTPDEWIESFIDLAMEYKTLMWGEESGQIIKSLDSVINKEMGRHKHFVYRQQFPSLTDKPSRARSFQAYMASGRVFIKNAEWTDTLIREMLSFPSGTHDDQVDALSIIGRMLYDMMVSVRKKEHKTEYPFKNNQVILPALSDKLSENTNYFRKI